MKAAATIRKAVREDRRQVAAMRAELWPDGDLEEHLSEFDEQLATGMNGTLPAATFVAQGLHGDLIGFVDAGLRSHAEGCDPMQAVGYVEGWFVRESERNGGIGRALLQAAEEWARSRGCLEMASDAFMDNPNSLAAHQALGFEVVESCYHFRKSL